MRLVSTAEVGQDYYDCKYCKVQSSCYKLVHQGADHGRRHHLKDLKLMWVLCNTLYFNICTSHYYTHTCADKFCVEYYISVHTHFTTVTFSFGVLLLE